MNIAQKQQVQHRNVIRHLGQMLRLGLEPITSANFFVTLSLVNSKTELFKNDAFSKRSIFKTLFETLFESLRFYQRFRVF